MDGAILVVSQPTAQCRKHVNIFFKHQVGVDYIVVFLNKWIR